jgi:hypothetical protein
MTDTDIRQTLEELIYNIAHVKDPLKKRLREKGRDETIVEKFISQNEPLQIVIDLANAAKHGYPLRWCRSKHEPRLGEVGRVLQFATGLGGCSSAVFTYDAKSGGPMIVTTGAASANVVLTADVLDKAGRRLGELMEIANQAVQAWERFLADQGVP